MYTTWHNNVWMLDNQNSSKGNDSYVNVKTIEM
jgi:hypothetical protein